MSGPTSGIPPLAPYTEALTDYHRGNLNAQLTLYSSLGEYDDIPVSVFFRGPDEFFPFDSAALEVCTGRVLDAGAGTGVHALELQAVGIDVVAVDSMPECVAIMRERGVYQARCANMFALDDERFDCVLMMMNGVGPVGTLAGLDRFLARAGNLLEPGGQVIVDSGEVKQSKRPGDAPRIDWPPSESGYVGESWIQLGYNGRFGGFFRELYVDARTLRNHADRAGWSTQVIYQGDDGEFVATLRPAAAR